MKIDKGTGSKVIALFFLMLCFSFNVSVIGQMLSTIKSIYQINYTAASRLVSFQSIGGLVLAVLSILLIDRMNKPRFLIVCGFVLGGLLMLIGLTPALPYMFMIFILLGFSGGAINTLTNPVMAETVIERTENYINLMHMIFSAGTVLAPMLSQFILSVSGYRLVFLVFGGLALAGSAYSLFAFKNQFSQKTNTQKISAKVRLRETLQVLQIKSIRQIFMIAVLITSWQLSAVYFISAFFADMSNSLMGGAVALSVFFFSMMVSRLIYSKFASKVNPGKVLAVSNLIGLIAWVLVFIAEPRIIKIVFVGLAALSCANNFPITFSTACKAAPKNTAAASGFVTFGYYIAIFIFIPIIGAIGDAHGLYVALLATAVPLVLMVPAGIGLSRKIDFA